jgi:predicted RNase H-like HicB family nuclease
MDFGEGARMSDLRYEIVLFFSEEDQSYIAEVPELAGCMADGPTYEAALKSAEVVIHEWIETAKELGRPIPQPRRGRTATKS